MIYDAQGNALNIGQTSPHIVRYMHYNVGHFANGAAASSAITAEDYELRKAWWNAFITQAHADIVGFNEWSDIFYDTETAQEAFLADYPWFSAGGVHGNGYVNNIFASKLPLHDFERVDFARGYYGYEAILDIGGKVVKIMECHLPTQVENDQNTAITAILSRYANDEHVIVAGDMNFIRADDKYKGMYKRFTDAGFATANCGSLGEIRTAYTNRYSCDYGDSIFIKGGRILDTTVVANENGTESSRTPLDVKNLSDHYPVICTLEIV